MPAPTSFMFDDLKARLGTGFDWTAVSAKILLVDAVAGYVPDRTAVFVSSIDPATVELDTDNYARVDVEDRAVDVDTDAHLSRWVASSPVFPTLGPALGGPVVGGAIVFEDVTDDTDSRLLFFLADVGGAVNGEDYTVTITASGLAVIREPS